MEKKGISPLATTWGCTAIPNFSDLAMTVKADAELMT